MTLSFVEHEGENLVMTLFEWLDRGFPSLRACGVDSTWGRKKVVTAKPPFSIDVDKHIIEL